MGFNVVKSQYIVAGAATAFVLLMTSACGAPEYCEKAAYTNFEQDEWATYCADYLEHTESPGNFSMKDLTKFFVRHPKKVEALQESLDKFEQADTCFVGSRRELEYRKLSACLVYNDQQKRSIETAWLGRAEPWMDAHELRIGQTKADLGDAERESKRLVKKVNVAFELHRKMNSGPYEEWSMTVDRLGDELEKGSQMLDEWSYLVKISKKNDLKEMMTKEIAPRMATASQNLEDQNGQHDQLLTKRRFLQFSVNSVGRSCPSGVAARKEKSIAAKALKREVRSIHATRPRVKTLVLPDQREGLDYESFDGFVCGERSSSNQFVGQPLQCGLYTYVLEREKPGAERRWGNWKVKSFEESGPEGGVDCALNQ